MSNIVEYPTGADRFIGKEHQVGATMKVWDGEKWVNKSFGNHETRLQTLETVAGVSTEPVPVSRGGTGSNNPSDALDKLGVRSEITKHNSDAQAHPELSAFITSEADRAEANADAAALSGNVFTNTADGIASGLLYFSVVSPSDNNYLDLYKNESGVAVFKKAYSSSAPINEILNSVESNVGSETIFTIEDASGRVTAYQRASDLAFMIPDRDGKFNNASELTSAVINDEGNGSLDTATDSNGGVYRWTDLYGGLHLQGLSGTVQSQINGVKSTISEDKVLTEEKSELNVGRLMLETSRTQALIGDSVYLNETVKPNGSDGTETQRIPGLVKLSENTAYLAWQQRLTGYNYVGDAEYQRLVGALITYDEAGGITVGSTVVIDQPSDVQKVSNHPHMFINSSNELVVLYNNNERLGGTGQYDIYMRKSVDGGQTWSTREQVLQPLVDNVTIVLGSNGTIIQIPDGLSNEGRWLVPVYGNGVEGAFSGLIYSDDDGVSWDYGSLLTNGFGIQEPSIALSHENYIVMAMRRSDKPGLVHFARLDLINYTGEWIDEGLAQNMKSPRCDMSMVQLSGDIGDGIPAVVHCGPSSLARRANRLRLSFTGGRKWEWEWKRPDVSDGVGAGYSSIIMLQRGLILVALETAESAATDSDIQVYIVNINEVMKNGNKL